MAPFFILSTVIALIYMLVIGSKVAPIHGTKEYFEKSYSELGAIKRDEKICAALFLISLAGVLMRPLFADLMPALAPAYILFMLGFASFIITAADKGPLLTWETAQNDAMWGMMLLFGGGLALGKLVNDSGAGSGIAHVISQMSLDGGLTTIIIIVFFACIISEATNSTVSAAVTIPIVLSLTAKLGLNAIPYWFITIMAYNAEFLLPVSVRAIPVSYGLDAGQMLKRGIPIFFIRMGVVIIAGYVFMKFWPFFSMSN